MTARKRALSIASGCLAAAAGASAASAGTSAPAFAAPRRRRARPAGGLGGDEYSICSIYRRNNRRRLEIFHGEVRAAAGEAPDPAWGIADDWSRLSAAAADVAPATSPAAGRAWSDDAAAGLLAAQEELIDEWAGAAAAAAEPVSSESLRGAAPKGAMPFVPLSHDDDFVESAVDVIASRADYYAADDGVNLYDTSTTPSTPLDQDRHDDEMALMIRCNQAPEQLLIDQGKALPELTEERKYAPDFLLAVQPQSPAASGDAGGGAAEGALRLPLRAKATPFLDRAVTAIFETHAVPTEDASVLDRGAIARWMTRCLSSPLAPGKRFTVGAHDQSVSAVLSRYSQTHGSGRLTHAEFQALYLEVAWAGYLRDLTHKRTALEPMYENDDDDTGWRHHPRNGGGRYRLPTLADAGVLIQGKKNTEKMLKEATVALVWRDLEAHGVFSPAEEERVQRLRELERAAAARAAAPGAVGRGAAPLLDECALLDDYADRLSHSGAPDDDDPLGAEGGWDFLARRKEGGSHAKVELASDGETPQRIRDGKFVFIDEESCIGCQQCANIAPSSFKMMDSGRARTFSQSNSLDVENAVMACPVSCMHHVSFGELKEMETARDDGDGRTDHRHFGGRRTHTPLHVSRRVSDANHKSSWYHYLKGKCHGSTCPDRGCYDCPQYAPGQNPFFKERHRKAELIRAKDFIESGEADRWRKVVTL